MDFKDSPAAPSGFGSQSWAEAVTSDLDKVLFYFLFFMLINSGLNMSEEKL